MAGFYVSDNLSATDIFNWELVLFIFLEAIHELNLRI